MLCPVALTPSPSISSGLAAEVILAVPPIFMVIFPLNVPMGES